MKALTHPSPSLLTRLSAFAVLTKPRVNALILFCALVGMLLAVPSGLPALGTVIAALGGIAAVAGAAAAMNCVVEQQIDARMLRTAQRPLPQGLVNTADVLVFSAFLGGGGLFVLHTWVNPLTTWLTLATFVGYALVYTLLLKPNTPQNIVIGGASGAMPPVLGWAAMTGSTPPEALLLFLIIFAWTPAHFWALALYRRHDYAQAGLPMLPVTHGIRYTTLSVLLYSLILLGTSLLPFVIQMSSGFYLVIAVALGGHFCLKALHLHLRYSDDDARKLFRTSIRYLSLLFATLLIDHFLF